MLGSITCVTVCVPSLDDIEDAYARFLDYRTIERGVILESQAAFWTCPAMEGSAYLLMSPMGSDDFCYRFIEGI